MFSYLKKSKGFSLLELLVVVAILGILATVGVISYTEYIDNSKMEIARNNSSKINRAFLQDYISIGNNLGSVSDIGESSTAGVRVTRHDSCLQYINKAVANINASFDNTYNKNIPYAVNLHHVTYLAENSTPIEKPMLQKGQIGLLCANACASLGNQNFFMQRCACIDEDQCVLQDYSTHPQYWDDNGLAQGYIGNALPAGVCPRPEAIQEGLECVNVSNNETFPSIELVSLESTEQIQLVQLDGFFTDFNGDGSAVSPLNIFSSSLDEAIQSYGYDTYTSWLKARDLGYAKTAEDADLWRRANGYSSNPYGDETRVFVIPATDPVVNMQPDQYTTDCAEKYSGKGCNELGKEEFKEVQESTHDAIGHGFLSYQQQTTAENNGWTDNLEWLVAKELGYTESQEDYDLYYTAILDSSNQDLCEVVVGATQGRDACASIPKSEYLEISSGVAAVDSIIDTITNDTGPLLASDLVSVLNATNEQRSEDVHYDNPLHLDYIEHCIESYTDPSLSDISSCVSNTEESDIATYDIGRSAENISEYGTDTINEDNLVSLNIAPDISNVIFQDYCGITGQDACIDELTDKLETSGLTENSTTVEVVEWLEDTLNTALQVTAQSAVIPEEEPLTGCADVINLAIPVICEQGQWDCTLEYAPDGWSLSNNILSFDTSFTDTVAQVSIKISSNIFTYIDYYEHTYNITQAVVGVSNGLKRYTNTDANILTAFDNCVALGGRLATEEEHRSLGVEGTDQFLYNSSVDAVRPEFLSTCTFFTQDICHSENICFHDGNSKQLAQKPIVGYIQWICGTVETLGYSYSCADLPSCD